MPRYFGGGVCVTAVSRSRCFRARATLYRQRRYDSGHETFSLPILPCYFPRFHGVIAGVLPIHTNEKGEGNKCTPCRLKRVGEESRALILMHGRSLMTIDPRIPTMPGRSTSGFHDFTDQAGRLGD